jgi:potassium efflux system protein
MMKIIYSIIAAVIILFASIGVFYYDNWPQKEAIHIAFVGPINGDGAAAGQLMTQAIQLYLDTVNEQGGVHGKKIVLDVFDDQNDSKKAKQQALEIVAQNRAVAVIGHWYSSSSISAGEIYKKYGIPAITPGSTNIKVTEKNPWYFRNIFTANASGRFLANYVQKVFQQQTVTIIQEEAAYGSYLASVFKQEAEKLGMTVKYHWKFHANDADLENQFQNLVKQLKTNSHEAGVILLAMQAVEGVQLVKQLKDAQIKNTLIGETSFSEQAFVNGFQHWKIEQTNPGYYTNDIYVATPLLFDTANESALQFKENYQAKYQQQPDWAAAYAYDTALLLIDAIQNTDFRGQPQTLKSDRDQIRDYLADKTGIEKAVKGITGFNYFDEHRNSQKPIVMGVYKNNQLISALTQLQTVQNINEIPDLNTALENEQVLLINDQYLYKTNVVYTGVEINKISEIDIKNLTCTLDFYLWFRFRGDFNPKNIKFFNAIEPISLGEPEIETSSAMTYHVYHVKGRFLADFMPQHSAFKQHILGFRFSHRDFNRNHLIYVTDVLGMGLNHQKSMVDRLQQHQVISPLQADWTIQKIWFFQDIVQTSSLGRFKSLSLPKNTIQYSRFNIGIQIKKDELALRGMIDAEWAVHLVIFSLVMIFLLILVDKNKKLLFLKTQTDHSEPPKKANFFKTLDLPIFASFKYSPYHSEPLTVFDPNFGQTSLYKASLDYPIWLLQLLFTSVLLLSSEVILLNQLVDGFDYRPQLIIMIFDILWWLLPALFINIAIKRFIWRPLEKRSGRSIPNVIRIVVTFVIYLLAIFGIVAFVYEQTLTSLLATSGMVAMIIGLAIQANLSNIFSGIVINLERPFRVGDWVKIGSFEEGLVIDVNWRTTRIKARNGHVLSIPNSMAAESDIQNYNYIYGYYFLWPTVYVDPIHPPERVQQVLLDAILAVEQGVLKQPEPSILFSGVNEWAAGYWVVFGIANYQDRFTILNNVWRSIWVHLDKAGILFAIQRQELYLFKGTKERRKTTGTANLE